MTKTPVNWAPPVRAEQIRADIRRRTMPTIERIALDFNASTVSIVTTLISALAEDFADLDASALRAFLRALADQFDETADEKAIEIAAENYRRAIERIFEASDAAMERRRVEAGMPANGETEH